MTRSGSVIAAKDSGSFRSHEGAFGRSLHVDCFGVSRVLCDDLGFFYQLLDDLTSLLHVQKQSPPYIFRSPADRFPDKAGLSGWVPLIESGISVHTLSIKGFVSLDVYTCGKLSVPKTISFLKQRLRPEKVQRQLLVRGIGYSSHHSLRPLEGGQET